MCGEENTDCGLGVSLNGVKFNLCCLKVVKKLRPTVVVVKLRVD